MDTDLFPSMCKNSKNTGTGRTAYLSYSRQVLLRAKERGNLNRINHLESDPTSARAFLVFHLRQFRASCASFPLYLPRQQRYSPVLYVELET